MSVTKRLVATLKHVGGPDECVTYGDKSFNCFDYDDEKLFASLKRRNITHVKHPEDVWGLPAGTHTLKECLDSWRTRTR